MNFENRGLEEVNKRMSSSAIGSSMGLFIDKLISGSDSSVKVVVEERSDVYLCKIMLEGTINNCEGFDFYNNDQSFEDVMRCCFVRVLAMCSRGVNHNVYNAEIEFVSENKKVFVKSPPLETHIASTDLEENYEVIYKINMTDNIVNMCSPIRRRSKDYERVNYVLRS